MEHISVAKRAHLYTLHNNTQPFLNKAVLQEILTHNITILFHHYPISGRKPISNIYCITHTVATPYKRMLPSELIENYVPTAHSREGCHNFKAVIMKGGYIEWGEMYAGKMYGKT